MLKEDFVYDLLPFDAEAFAYEDFWINNSSILISKSRAFKAEDGIFVPS